MTLPEHADHYLAAAAAADGAQVLELPVEDDVDTPPMLGRRLLQAIFGTTVPGGTVPVELAELIARPADPVALAVVADHVDGVLLDRPELDTAVTEIVSAAWRRLATEGDGHAMTCLGDLLGWSDNRAVARAWYEAAVDAGDDTALLRLGLLLGRSVGGPDGIAFLRRAAASADRDVAAEGALLLAQALWRRGDAAGGRAAFQAAIDSGHPEWAPDAMIDLAVRLEKDGDREGARAAWRQAGDSGHPSYGPEARHHLGEMLRKDGDIAGARAAWEPVIASGDPEWAYPSFTDLVGMARDLGDVDGIRDAHRLAVQAGLAEAPYALMVIGELLAQRGEIEGAHAMYREAIDTGLEDFFADNLRDILDPPVCTEKLAPFQIVGLDDNGTVLDTIDYTPDACHR